MSSHLLPSERSAPSERPAVCVVTVTYGDRWPLLSHLLEFAQQNDDIDRVVVVDNGSHTPVAPLATRARFSKVTVVRNERNQGSAAGFKLGLEKVQELHPGWIWLLDDDNVPEAGALETLLREGSNLAEEERSRHAFLAFRPEHQADIAAGIDVKRCYPAHSSFCLFHVMDIPYKVWRRVRRPPSLAHKMVPKVTLPYAPYSGLLFHRLLLERIGTPKADLVLYADDTEFSYRIVAQGGTISLITGAQLRELEPSWNASRTAGSSFAGWLKSGTDFRVFYRARNRAYFDVECWSQNALMYHINRFTYLTLLRLYAMRHRQLGRYHLFRHAVRLGERGQLGLAEEHPLP